MTQPVSLEEYAEAADRRIRELADRPMDLSGLGNLPEMGSAHAGPSQSYSRPPPVPTARPEIMSDYGDSAGYIAAGATFDPVRGWVGRDGNDMVISSATPPAPDKADWRVTAYFTSPYNLGLLAGPQNAAHIGFKARRNGVVQYVLDGGPSFNPGLGNLRFNGSPEELGGAREGIPELGEFNLSPPKGINAQTLGERLKQAAQDYDGSRPYDLPPFGLYKGGIVGNMMEKNEYNSNSFAAGLLNRAGAAANIPGLQKHMTGKSWTAPGLEQPLPSRYFRNR
jgi:hypothetical protein